MCRIAESAMYIVDNYDIQESDGEDCTTMADDQQGCTAAADWEAWIALKMVPGVRNVLGLGLVRAFGTPRAVFAARDQDLQCAGVRREVRSALRRFDRWAEARAQV